MTVLTFSCTKNARFHKEVEGAWKIENSDSENVDSYEWVLNTEEINEICFMDEGICHIQMSAVRDSVDYHCNTDIVYNIAHKNFSKLILFDKGCDPFTGSWGLNHIDRNTMEIGTSYRFTLK